MQGRSYFAAMRSILRVRGAPAADRKLLCVSFLYHPCESDVRVALEVVLVPAPPGERGRDGAALLCEGRPAGEVRLGRFRGVVPLLRRGKGVLVRRMRRWWRRLRSRSSGRFGERSDWLSKTR